MKHTLLITIALLALLAAPACAEEWEAIVTPDAALFAQSLGADGGTVEAVSWQVASYDRYRAWADVLKPLDAPGIGASVDAGSALCIGAGYHHGWRGYVGAHVRF